MKLLVCPSVHPHIRGPSKIEESGTVSPIRLARLHPGFDPSSDRACYIRCKNLALISRDCVSLCLSDETLKAVGPFYLVSMPGEVKDPTRGVNV